jgi:hypothetical protein
MSRVFLLTFLTTVKVSTFVQRPTYANNTSSLLLCECTFTTSSLYSSLTILNKCILELNTARWKNLPSPAPHSCIKVVSILRFVSDGKHPAITMSDIILQVVGTESAMCIPSTSTSSPPLKRKKFCSSQSNMTYASVFVSYPSASYFF